MEKAIVHLLTGKQFSVEYEADEIVDIFSEMDKEKGIIVFNNLSVYSRAIEAIEWID
jgi:hypothetical protein